MDLELFQFDDDDELLSNAYIEATQNHQEASGIELNEVEAPEFQCAGEDTNKSEFATDSFIKKGFIKSSTKLWYSPSSIGRDLHLSVCEFLPGEIYGRTVTQLVFAESCKNIQNLVMSARGNCMAVVTPTSCLISENEHYQKRCQVTNLYHILLRTMHASNWPLIQPHLARLRQLINSVLDADLWKLIYFANSPKGNECKVPTYHLLHGSLEWRLLDLCILQKYDIVSNDLGAQDALGTTAVTGTNSITFYTQLTRIFNDLLLCASYHYSKKRTTDLLYSTPFACTCIKEFWLILQQLIMHWSSDTKDDSLEFQKIFNKAMNGILEKRLLPQLEYTQFANWMINAMARLHTLNSLGVAPSPDQVINYNCSSTKRYVPENAENYELLCNCTQQFLNANPQEEQLRVYICLLMPVLMKYWRPRIDIVILLWEYFHKRLNSSFYISGSAPSSLAVTSASGRSYLERCQSLLAKEQPDVNLSSFTLHVLLLGKTVQQFEYGSGGINCNSNQTKKLIGRINSKFSLQKFLTLSETGIHHLIELFLVLSLSDSQNLLMTSMRDRMLTLEFKLLSGSKQLAVAKGHMAMLILHTQNQLNLSSYINKLLAQLECINNDPVVCRVFADGLLDIFTTKGIGDTQFSALDVDLDEHLFIDKWLSNFLVRSKPFEQERTLEALHLIFDKYEKRLTQSNGNLDSSAKNKVLMETLNKHVLPFLRLQFNNNNSIWMSQLAADFCLYAADKRTFDMLCNYFCILSQPINQSAQPQIMLKLMQNPEKLQLLDPSTILQVWLKSLVLLTGQHKLVMELTEHVVKIPEFNFMISSFTTVDDLIKTEAEPLYLFIAAVGKHYNECTENTQRLKIADNFNSYLQNFEKWAECNGKLDLSEVPMRFYSFIATVLYNCASLVYVKSKPNCFFHLAITRFVLPQNIQMGQPPVAKLAQVIHKIWLVVLQGIGRLNFKSDKYINKTLNDLIEKWVPNFKISTNAKIVAKPFIGCIKSENKELALYVFDRLTSTYLSVSKRLMNPNACFVIAIYQEVINDLIAAPIDNDSSEQNLLTFMKATTLLTLEHNITVDMKSPSYEMVLTIFRTILPSRLFNKSRDARELLLEHLRLVTQKHMPYITFFCFQLLMKLVEIYPPIIVEFMDFLRIEVAVIEEKRGGSEDGQLRGFLRKLEATLEKQLSHWNKKNEINKQIF